MSTCDTCEADDLPVWICKGCGNDVCEACEDSHDDCSEFEDDE